MAMAPVLCGNTPSRSVRRLLVRSLIREERAKASATPISDRRAIVSARRVPPAVLAFFASAALGCGLAVPALAGNLSNWTADFYSYLPAAPDIKAPNLDFIPFWTDDLKK